MLADTYPMTSRSVLVFNILNALVRICTLIFCSKGWSYHGEGKAGVESPCQSPLWHQHPLVPPVPFPSPHSGRSRQPQPPPARMHHLKSAEPFRKQICPQMESENTAKHCKVQARTEWRYAGMSHSRAAGLTMTLVRKPIPSFRSTEVHSASVFQEGGKKGEKVKREENSPTLDDFKKKQNRRDM